MARGVSALSKSSAEFLGTFMLVFCVGLIKTAGRHSESLALFGPTAIGFTLTALEYMLFPISGGHFNPAVSFAAALSQKVRVPHSPITGDSNQEISKLFEFKDAVLYMMLQCSAGAIAGFLAATLYGYDDTAEALGPRNGDFWVGAPLVEFLYTMMLVFVYLNVVLSKAGKQFYGLAIGLVMIAGGYGGGYVSGAAFNPAVAIGMNFVNPSWRTLYLPVYIVVQFLGAVFGLIAFKLVRQDAQKMEDPTEQVADPRVGEAARVASKAAFLKANEVQQGLVKYFDPEDTSEFIGAFFYALSVALNQLAAENDDGKWVGSGGAWSNAASLMCVYYAVGDISGGVFNPAVTIACLGRWFGTSKGFGGEKLCDPKVSAKEGIKYILAQTVGVAAAGLVAIVTYILREVPVAEVTAGCLRYNETHSQDETAYVCAETYSVGQGFFAEFFGTFFICYTFLAVATIAADGTTSLLKPAGNDQQLSPFAPVLGEYTALAVGGVFVAAGYAFGPLSHGLLNPAVTFVNALYFGASMFWKPEPIAFFTAQCLGGAAAAAVFRFLTHHHHDPHQAAEGREDQTRYINLDA